jgi:hypothetical protein
MENNIPKKCNDCPHIGHYETGPYSRSPHCCCELIWELFKIDYRINKNKLDSKCPLKNKHLQEYKKEALKIFNNE